MPRFTIKDLLIATTLIAIGAGLIVYALQHQPVFEGEPIRLDWALPIGWFAGGGFVGAGLFAPFGKLWLGFATGL